MVGRGEWPSGLRLVIPRQSEGGGARMLGRRSLANKYSALWGGTPYVRHGNAERHRQRRAQWAWGTTKIAS
eukprot:3524775-Pyramimonas_sp.AAC.1